MSSIHVLPSCAMCFAVTKSSEKSWLISKGVMATTAQKLMQCGQCQLAQYCSTNCQTLHWNAHQIRGCVATRTIQAEEVDRMINEYVKESNLKQSVRVIMDCNSRKKIASITTQRLLNTQDGKLYVDVKMDERVAGQRTYLLCYEEELKVEASIQPPIPITLSDELELKIKNAQMLSYSDRDVTMINLAKEIVTLGLYDRAFELIFDWVSVGASKDVFFKYAVSKMIENHISHEKIVELARSIYLSENLIIEVTVSVHALHNLEFALQLARQQFKWAEHYFETIFFTLLSAKKKDEARGMLPLFSTDKQQQLAQLFRK